MAAPLTVILFGATGDLSKRKLIPGMLHLFQSRLLDDVRVFLGETPPSDDTTLLLVRREALPDSERRPTPAD